MTYNSDHANRRTLTFPAVKPCVSICYSTLMNSLISLSTTISSFNSCHALFTSNTQNAKSALRLIHLLEFFLEDVKDANFRGKSIISSLSDLHVALQELIFLFQDLTRRDARVWMLMSSGMAADHFDRLFRAVVDALDGLPATVVGSCDEEVAEMVEFLTRQVRRGGFQVETRDKWGSSAVSSALGRLRRGVIPDPSELRRIMDYLGINSWAECNEQVKFLEHENGFNESGSEQAVSLLGLMVYCRCVLFHHIDSGDDKNIKGKQSESCIGVGLKSDDLKCPISLEIMVDPVTIWTGHTYDRGSILKWFKSGSSVCPKTGQMLERLDLVPNVSVKHLISHYCLENGVSLPSLEIKGSIKNGVDYYQGNLVAEGAIKMVADFLSIKLAMGTLMEKNKAAYEIRLITKRSGFSRACFVESGVIPYLLNLILCKDPTTQENSMAALLNLSKHSESKSIIVNNGGLGLAVRVLKKGIKMEARQHAAAILFYLSSVEEYRRLIGNNPDAIPLLVELIRVGDDQGKKNALVAIYALLMLPSNHSRVLLGRLVPLLVTLLDSLQSEDLIVDSLAVLSALAQKRDGANSILHARPLTTIVKVLCSSTSDSSRFRGEHCVSLLLSLCINGGAQVVQVLVKSTSLMGALYSFLVDGTSRTSNKANSLISILHQYSETTSSPSMPHTLPRTHFIHVS